MKNKEQIFFFKRLSFLAKAGIPLLESLVILEEQAASKKSHKMLSRIIEDISAGQSLSQALQRFNKIFGEFSINIIHVGEQAGILPENLEYLSEELKEKHLLKRKVVGAFVYPAVVTSLTLGITVFLIVYLFPKILPVFLSLHIALPLSTRIVIAISNILRHYGLYIALALCMSVMGIVVLLKKNIRFRMLRDILLLKLPILGKIIKEYNVANSTRTLGILVRSGLTLQEAVEIASTTNTNLVYRRELVEIRSCIDRGEKISYYIMQRKEFFPSLVGQIISVGERSGNLPHSLSYLSEIYKNEIDEFTKNLSNLTEPFLMIFMGLFVGFIALSIITPIYSITQNLR